MSARVAHVLAVAAAACAPVASREPEDTVAPHAVDAAAPHRAEPPDGAAADASSADSATPAPWRVPSRAYVDGGVRSAAEAYAQDPWNETMNGDGGAASNPFTDARLFACTFASEATGRVLSCAAKLSDTRRSSIRRIVLHNTLESLPDAVSIFARNRPWFRTDRSHPVSIHHVVGRDGRSSTWCPRAASRSTRDRRPATRTRSGS
jgi:hypothetical protein